MSINLFLVRTHKIGITNILTALVTKTLGDQVYHPCSYSLTGKFINTYEGEFTVNFPYPSIRNIIWDSNTSASLVNYLEQSLNQAINQNKIVTLGCHDDNSILHLLKKYHPHVTSAGLYYNIAAYDLLLKDTAEYHLYMLSKNIIEPSEHDKSILANYTYNESINHYINVFNDQNLFPKQSHPICNFNLSYTDLFDKKRVENLFNDIGFPLTEESSSFYDSWLSQYSDR
jgi:hypothetical protein